MQNIMEEGMKYKWIVKGKTFLLLDKNMKK